MSLRWLTWVGSQIPPASTLTGAETFPIVQSAATNRTTLQSIADWVVQSAASFVPSGTGALATDLQTWGRQVIYATNYAANGVSGTRVDPTGVTDSAAGINAALTYAGTFVNANTLYTDQVKNGAVVVLPPGTYLTTSASIVVPAGVSLIGGGKTSSIIKSSYNGPIIRNSIDSGYNWFGGELHNFGVYGDLTKALQYGLDFLRPLNCTFSNIYVQGCGKDGVRVRQGIASTLHQVDSVYNKVNGIFIDGGVNSWADQTANNLPSNGNLLLNCHSVYNDGPGLLFGTYTNGNTVYTGGYEYNYYASGDNVGFNIEFRTSGSIMPNELVEVWTEGPVQAHVYQSSGTSSVVNKVTRLRHFANGVAGNVDRAIFSDVGTLIVDSAVGQNSSYKSIAGSVKPFRVTKATGVIWTRDCSGSTITDGLFVEDENGLTTGLHNNSRQFNYGRWYGVGQVITDFGNNAPTFLATGESFNWFEISNFYRGFQFGTGSTALDTNFQRVGAGQMAVKNATGAGFNLKIVTALVPAAAGATITAASLIPDGAFVVGVSTRIIATLGNSTGTTGYQIGDGTTATRWGTNASRLIDTTTTNADAPAATFVGGFVAANNVVLTATGGNFDAVGSVRVAVCYIDVTAPTS